MSVKERIKKAIAILEVNKIMSHSQTEAVEALDIAIKALEKQIEMLEHCDGSCVRCPYSDLDNSVSDECMNNFIIDLNWILERENYEKAITNWI